MSAIYPVAKQAFLTGNLNWDANPDIYALLLNDTYDYNNGGDQHNDVTDTGQFPTSALIGGTGFPVAMDTTRPGGAMPGVAYAADTVFQGVTDSVDVHAILIYDNSTNMPLVYVDNGTNLPLTPNGGDITIFWNINDGAVFQL